MLLIQYFNAVMSRGHSDQLSPTSAFDLTPLTTSNLQVTDKMLTPCISLYNSSCDQVDLMGEAAESLTSLTTSFNIQSPSPPPQPQDKRGRRMNKQLTKAFKCVLPLLLSYVLIIVCLLMLKTCSGHRPIYYLMYSVIEIS